MPRILELKTINDQLWARIPNFGPETAVTLWTESEKTAVLVAERERCMTAIQRLGQADLIDEAVRNAYETA